MSGKTLVSEQAIDEQGFGDDTLRQNVEQSALDLSSHYLVQELAKGGKYVVSLCQEWVDADAYIACGFPGAKRFRVTTAIKQVQTMNYRKVMMGPDDWAALPPGCWWCRLKTRWVNLKFKVKHLWLLKISNALAGARKGFRTLVRRVSVWWEWGVVNMIKGRVYNSRALFDLKWWWRKQGAFYGAIASLNLVIIVVLVLFRRR